MDNETQQSNKSEEIVNGKIEEEIIIEEIDMKAKIVTFDIENMANLLWSWSIYGGSNGWRAIDVEHEWHILCFAYKWLGKKAEVVSIWDQKGYKPMIKRLKGGATQFSVPDERALMQKMWDILDEADIVVGWNSVRFDTKKVQAKMVAMGFKPPSPFKEVDVMAKKKQICASNSNKLDDTGVEWDLGRKLPHSGWSLWKGCAEGDVKSQKKMERYNIQDVVLTEKTYLRLRPWMKTHPNLNYYSRDIKACSVCGQEKTLVKRGWAPSGQRRRQIYHCAPERGGCGKYCSGELLPQDPNSKIIITK